MDEIVQVKNVTKRFGEETVLSDLSFSFESGKIYGLVGKNGSGKSVLCKLIAGVLHPNQGEIIVEGVLLEKGVFPPSIGVILDNTGFLPGYSGFQNLKMLASIRRRVTDEDIRETLRLVGLEASGHKHYGKYSVGMKQKLAIAQAIMERPELLLLDEPFNGLDADSVKNMRSLFRRLNRELGTTIIFTSHYAEDMEEISDCCYEVKDGKVTEVCRNELGTD